jgi:hypothetical protein
MKSKIYRPSPNSRWISQPSNPAAASGRAEVEARVGAGRYPPADGKGASDAEAGEGLGAVICDAVA